MVYLVKYFEIFWLELMATNFSPSSGSNVLNKFPSISQWSDTGPPWPSCSFSHGVFKRLFLQTHKNKGLFGKGFNQISIGSIAWILLMEIDDKTAEGTDKDQTGHFV